MGGGKTVSFMNMDGSTSSIWARTLASGSFGFSAAKLCFGVLRFQQPHVRSKLASGVPMLMSTVQDASCLNDPQWGSRKDQQAKKKKRKRTKLQKLERTIRNMVKKVQAKLSKKPTTAAPTAAS